MRDLAPQAVCPTSGSAKITLTGEGFVPMVADGLRSHPYLALPQVSLARTLVINGTGQSGPQRVDLDPGAVRWAGASTLEVDVGAVAAVPGLYSIEVTNANGEKSVFTDSLLIVPPPAPRMTQPFAIAAASTGDVTLQGDFFVVADDATPTVQLSGTGIDPMALEAKSLDGCRAMPGSARLQTCSQLTFTPPATLPAGNYAIEVVDPAPANCSSNAIAQKQGGALALTVVPVPKLAGVAADVACNALGAVTLSATGANFLLAGQTAPTLQLGQLSVPTSASGCSPLPLDPGLAPRPVPLSSCTQLSATLPIGAVPPGTAVTAVVQNPPGGGTSADPVSFFSEPIPQITTLTTAGFVCTAGGKGALALDGSGFVVADGQAPTVLVGGAAAAAKGGNCAPVPNFRAGVTVCSKLTVEVPPTAATGTYPLALTNPGGAGCAAQQSFSVVNVPPPTVTAIKPAAARFCSAATSTFTVTGANFLFTGVDAPTVHLGGGGKLATVPKNCQPIPGAPLGAGQVCGALQVTLAAGAVLPNPAGYTLTVKNPAPADCGAAAALPFFVEPAPTITGATVSSVVGGAAIIFITGTGFAPGAAISVGGVPTSGGAVLSPTSAVAVVATGAAPGNATVTVDNGDGCAATSSVGVVGFAGTAPPAAARAGALGSPPSATFGPVSTPVAFPFAGAVGELTSVELRRARAAPETLLFSSSSAGSLEVLVPSGTAAGRYDVVAVDSAGAAQTLGGLEVVDSATLALTAPAIDLTAGQSVALDVGGLAAGAAGAPAPQAWLVSSDVPGAVAQALAVAWASGALRVTVAADANLKPGDYELVVLEPAASAAGAAAQVGVVSRAVRVRPRRRGVAGSSSRARSAGRRRRAAAITAAREGRAQ